MDFTIQKKNPRGNRSEDLEKEKYETKTCGLHIYRCDEKGKGCYCFLDFSGLTKRRVSTVPLSNFKHPLCSGSVIKKSFFYADGIRVGDSLEGGVYRMQLKIGCDFRFLL